MLLSTELPNDDLLSN